MFRSVKFPAVTAGIVLGGFLLLLLPSQSRAQGKPWVRIDDSSRFQVLQSFNNEAVLDRETGLIWQRTVGATPKNHKLALGQCWQAETGGRRGWRLPKASELNSLIDVSALSSPHLPAGHPFMGALNGVQWTDTPLGTRAEDGNYITIDMSFSGVSVSSYDAEHFAWCVRGGGETY